MKKCQYQHCYDTLQFKDQNIQLLPLHLGPQTSTTKVQQIVPMTAMTNKTNKLPIILDGLTVTRLIKEGQPGDYNVIINQKRKKVTEKEVYQALNELGFEKYTEQLKEFMVNYSEKEDEHKNQLLKKRKVDENGQGQNHEMVDNADANQMVQSKSKKLKENNHGEEEFKIIDIQRQ
ncbi:UNKNOWN [Stylonychia lemnae]|uniref:Uncharacterized protein n=1 Tax=Stylonychia lemnae TaxID=5949 RepID=A0A078AHK1_STYLE|nr:UNKNOWN [Stylonychia lemnae]|eukprot:CDW80308.1 UNKNOWN [Stylonychia lemnae]